MTNSHFFPSFYSNRWNEIPLISIKITRFVKWPQHDTAHRSIQFESNVLSGKENSQMKSKTWKREKKFKRISNSASFLIIWMLDSLNVI